MSDESISSVLDDIRDILDEYLKRIADALEGILIEKTKLTDASGKVIESAGEKNYNWKKDMAYELKEDEPKPAPQEESKWIEFKGYMRGYTPKAIQVIIPNDTKQWFPRKQVVNIDDIDEDETNIPQFFKVTRWIANQKGIEHILEGRD